MMTPEPARRRTEPDGLVAALTHHGSAEETAAWLQDGTRKIHLLTRPHHHHALKIFLLTRPHALRIHLLTLLPHYYALTHVRIVALVAGTSRKEEVVVETAVVARTARKEDVVPGYAVVVGTEGDALPAASPSTSCKPAHDAY